MKRLSPALSIEYVETETVAGRPAMFEVTASTPFVGTLDVAYQPEQSDGDFLDESDGPNSEDWSSGQNRVVPLDFELVGADYKATLMVATVDDETDSDGGSIAVSLQEDPETTDTYTVTTTPGANTDTAMVIKAPIPELTIVVKFNLCINE